jgi:hypothetical protein
MFCSNVKVADACVAENRWIAYLFRYTAQNLKATGIIIKLRK